MPLRERTTQWALWLVVSGAGLYLCYRRYHLLETVVPTSPDGNGGDLWTFLQGARQILAGHSLYTFSQARNVYGYVYTPLVAIVLLPFAHASAVHVWKIWTAISLVALVVFGGLVTLHESPALRSWRQPLLFGFTLVTAMQFLPVKLDQYLGQSDAFALVLLAGAALSWERSKPAVSGVLAGAAGLLKTWPAAAILAVLQRDRHDRTRHLVAFVVTLAIGPVLAIAVGGASGLTGFLQTTFDARSQRLVSDSAWGAPSLLFSHSGLARPLYSSAVLRDVVTLLLVAWVVALLLLTLRAHDHATLCFWNVVACVVLLLPVSHGDYQMYLLPLLWIWAAQWLAAPRIGGPASLILALLMLWWLASDVLWAPQVPTVHSSSVGQSAIFFIDLVGTTASVVGTRLLACSRKGTSERQDDDRPPRDRCPEGNRIPSESASP